MDRREGALAEAPVWRDVSDVHLCPACGRDERCRVAHEAGFVHCFGRESTRPIEGGGWLHVVGVDGCHAD